MSRLAADMKAISHLLRGRRRDLDHAAALEDFYAPQARVYDEFRERLLHGRSDLLARMDTQKGQTLVELGCGTGRNLEFLPDHGASLRHAWLVDICPSLLVQARERFAGRVNVTVVEADACRWRPPHPVDRVLCCYSLSMMRGRERALSNAVAMLKPGGLLGIVDFYVSHHDAPAGRVRHAMPTRIFWKTWFAHDGVELDHDIIDQASQLTELQSLDERAGMVPYLPGLRAPYFVYVGRRAPCA